MTIVATSSLTEQSTKHSAIEDVILKTQTEWRLNNSSLLDYYETVERTRIRVIERPDLGAAFRFRENESLPLYGWFNFKEGFTKRLVDGVLDEFGHVLDDGSAIADPFAGMATTLLGGALRGIHTIGVEVNPFFHWVGSCKLNAHKVDVSVAREVIQHIVTAPLSPTPISAEHWPVLSTFHKYYDPPVLSALLEIRDRIRDSVGRIGDRVEPDVQQATEDLLLVGLAPILELGCHLEKKGRGLKRRKQSLSATPNSAVTRLVQQWNLMLDDVEKLNSFMKSQPFVAPSLVKSSALEHRFQQNSLGLVLCSPPYCNSFDYSEVYKLELWFFEFVRTYSQWRDLRKQTLRSHTATTFGRGFANEHYFPPALRTLIEYLSSDPVRTDTWTNYGELVRGYFDDMTLVMQRLADGCKPGAKVVMVVGNSSYLGLPVATDLLLSELSRQFGFRPVEVRVGRRLVTAGQQWRFTSDKAKRYLRESAIVLERN